MQNLLIKEAKSGTQHAYELNNNALTFVNCANTGVNHTQMVQSRQTIETIGNKSGK